MELVGSDIASAFAITKLNVSRLLFLRGEDNNRINNKGKLKMVELEAYTPDDNAGILPSFPFDPGIVKVSSRYHPDIIQVLSRYPPVFQICPGNRPKRNPGAEFNCCESCSEGWRCRECSDPG